MKHFVAVCFLFLAGVFCLSAQSSIVDALQENVPFQGKIRINVSSEINQLIGKKSADEEVGNVTYTKAGGYRVQIFSGNEQRTSKAEALKREGMINEAFPEVFTYVFYKAPYWRLRVGDCRSQEEAYLLMKQIAQGIPSLKKEMYVVRDEIKILVNQ